MKARRLLVPAGIGLVGLTTILAVHFVTQRIGTGSSVPAVPELEVHPDPVLSIDEDLDAERPLAADDGLPVTVAREALPIAEQPADALETTDEELNATLDVRVVSSGSSEPIPGIRLSLRGGPVELTAVTDSDGRAQFSAASSMPLQLHADGRWVGTSDDERSVNSLDPGDSRQIEVALDAPESRRYFARVVDAETSAPLPGTRVRLLLGGGLSSFGEEEELLAQTTSAQDGSISFWIADFGRDVIQLDAAGYATALVQVQGGHTTRSEAQELSMVRAASISVTVVNGSGEPAEGVQLALQAGFKDLLGAAESSFFLHAINPAWSTVTSSAGIATLHGLPPGVPLDLELSRGDRVLQVERGIQLRAGELLSLERKLGHGTEIRGHSREADGSVAAGVEIWLARAEIIRDRHYFRASERDRLVDSTISDERGGFSFTGIGAGRYWLGPAPDRELRTGEAPGDVIASAAIPVLLEESSETKELSLVVHRGLFVEGTVVDAAGQPAASVKVGSYTDQVWVRSDEKGRFAFGPLSPGNYRIGAAVEASRHAGSAQLTVAAGALDCRLELISPASVHGRVIDSATLEPVACEVKIIAEDPRKIGLLAYLLRSDPEGYFSQTGLIPGGYRLMAVSSGTRAGYSERFDLLPDQKLENMTVELAPAGVLRVRFEGDAERPAQVEIYDESDLLIHPIIVHPNSETLVTVVPGPIRFVPVGKQELVGGERTVVVLVNEEVEVLFQASTE